MPSPGCYGPWGTALPSSLQDAPCSLPDGILGAATESQGSSVGLAKWVPWWACVNVQSRPPIASLITDPWLKQEEDK